MSYEFKATDFHITPEPEGSALPNAVTIQLAPFTGVVFRLGAVTPIPSAAVDAIQLDYVYEIVSCGGHEVEALRANPDFIEMMNAFVGKSFFDYMEWLKAGKND